MNPVQVIIRKRDGHTLTDHEIRFLIDAYRTGEMPDYQMAAFLMAAQLQGLNLAETNTLTECMLRSGAVMDFSDVPGAKVDKHSTGGVGDKVSLVLAPIVGSCGVRVPMISGRALGHTGGTLDKLESIPGFRTDIPLSRFRSQLREVGVVLLGQTAEIAPADQKLYALRDVTANVDFIPFITASIMSKKLAEGLDGLVLDVKMGRGAFMKTEAEARELGQWLVRVGETNGTPTVALLTDMNVPLGLKVGNWLEVEESIDCLNGRGPADLMTLVYQLCAEMIFMAGLAESVDAGLLKAREAVATGRALDKMIEIVEAQGGDPEVIRDPHRRPRSLQPSTVHAPEWADGYVSDIDAMTIAEAGNAMGVGRLVQDDMIDPEAGIALLRRPGDSVSPGDPIADFYTARTSQAVELGREVMRAFSFSSSPPDPRPVLVDRLSLSGWKRGR